MRADLTTVAMLPDRDALATLIVNSHMVALALAQGDRLLLANAAFDRLFGRAREAAGGSILELISPEDRQQVSNALRKADGTPGPCVVLGLRGSNATFEVELQFEPLPAEGEPRLAIFAQDVTDRFWRETQLNLLAYSDPLTGLANRALFADRLRVAVLAARRTGLTFAVLMLDLDGFKAVNDRHGHDAGDLVLQRIAARLLAGVRDTDTIARLGGDEFVALLPAIKSRGGAMDTADRLIELAAQPIDVGDGVVTVGACAGVAIYPDHATTVDALLVGADRALYAAKRAGRGHTAMACATSATDAAPPPLVWSVAFQLGAPEIDAQHERLVVLLNGLIAALRNGEAHEAALRDVVDYTAFHFAAEERLMHEIDFPCAGAHAEMHRRLRDDIIGLRLEGTQVSVSLIARYLREWLVSHVNGADRDLAAALAASVS